MTLLLYYVGTVAIFCAVSIALGLAIETTLPSLSMPIFLVLFFASLWIAWIIAVKLTEPRTESAPILDATSDQQA